MAEKEMSDMMFSRFTIAEYAGFLPKEFFANPEATMEIALMLFAQTAREWGVKHESPYLAKVTAEDNEDGVMLTAELLATEEEANDYKQFLLMEQIGAINIQDKWSERVEK
jgi:hypothetical protein